MKRERAGRTNVRLDHLQQIRGKREDRFLCKRRFCSPMVEFDLAQLH